jgi:hypothetical protein
VYSETGEEEKMKKHTVIGIMLVGLVLSGAFAKAEDSTSLSAR